MAQWAKPPVRRLHLDGGSRSPSRSPGSCISKWFSDIVIWNLALCGHGVWDRTTALPRIFLSTYYCTQIGSMISGIIRLSLTFCRISELRAPCLVNLAGIDLRS